MNVYVPNATTMTVGGGWSFLRNLKTALAGRVNFVATWQEADVVFIFSVTTTLTGEIHEAHRAGKKIVLRVDNIPRRSRNRRMSPVERMVEFAQMAKVVVYQSEWAKKYASFFCGDGIIIKNGVDFGIFNATGRQSDGHTYLYLNYNDNPNKRFDEALYWFDIAWRGDREARLLVGGNAPSVYLENPQYKWDVPSGAAETIRYVGVQKTPEEVAALMRQCDFLLFPSFAEAYPNTLLEARACGVEPLYVNPVGGALEAERDPLVSAQQMGESYLEVFNNCLV